MPTAKQRAYDRIIKITKATNIIKSTKPRIYMLHEVVR